MNRTDNRLDTTGNEVSGDDTPDLLLDDEISPSTPYSDTDADTMDELDVPFKDVFYPDFSHIDVDVIPLIHFTSDLTEVKEFLNRRVFWRRRRPWPNFCGNIAQALLATFPNPKPLQSTPFGCLSG